MKKSVKEESIGSGNKGSVKKKKEFKIEIVRVGRLQDKTAGSGECVIPACKCVSCECKCECDNMN